MPGKNRRNHKAHQVLKYGKQYNDINRDHKKKDEFRSDTLYFPRIGLFKKQSNCNKRKFNMHRTYRFILDNIEDFDKTTPEYLTDYFKNEYSINLKGIAPFKQNSNDCIYFVSVNDYEYRRMMDINYFILEKNNNVRINVFECEHNGTWKIPKSKVNNTLFVYELPIKYNEEDIYDLFSIYGDIYEIRISKYTKFMRVFIVFESANEVINIITDLLNIEFDGNLLLLNFADNKIDKTDKKGWVPTKRFLDSKRKQFTPPVPPAQPLALPVQPPALPVQPLALPLPITLPDSLPAPIAPPASIIPLESITPPIAQSTSSKPELFDSTLLLIDSEKHIPLAEKVKETTKDPEEIYNWGDSDIHELFKHWMTKKWGKETSDKYFKILDDEGYDLILMKDLVIQKTQEITDGELEMNKNDVEDIKNNVCKKTDDYGKKRDFIKSGHWVQIKNVCCGKSFDQMKEIFNI